VNPDQALDQLAAVHPTPPPMSAALERELGALGKVAARRPGRQLAALAGLSLIYGAGLLAAERTRPDLGGLPRAWLVAAGAAWLLGFFVPCYLALVPRPGAVTPRFTWAGASAAAASVFFVALGVLVHPHGAASVTTPGWVGVTHGYGCLGMGLLAALVPVAIGAIFLRGALPVGSRWVAAALGAGGGALGGLFLHLHCPMTSWQHVGLIHGGVVVVAALLSAALVPATLART
jgi:hypothetical protein